MADGIRALGDEALAAKTLIETYAEFAADEDDRADLVEGETGLFECISAVIDIISEDEMLLKGIESREDDLSARKRKIKDRIARHQAMIGQAMQIADLVKPIKLPEATVSLSKRAAKLVIHDESEIPTQYWKRGDPRIDRSGLTAAIKSLGEGDEPIPGCALEPQPKSVTIRRK